MVSVHEFWLLHEAARIEPIVFVVVGFFEWQLGLPYEF